MKSVVVGLLSTAMLLGLPAAAMNRALAIAPFKKQFDALYVKKDGSAEEKALAAKVETAKCNVCHLGEKKERNAYGQALAKLLNKTKDKDDVEKIKASLKKVEDQHSDPKNEKSPTFGELLKQGKLPGDAAK